MSRHQDAGQNPQIYSKYFESVANFK